MDMIIMTNGQLSIPCFERSGNFSCSYSWKESFSSKWSTDFCVALNKNCRKKMRTFGLRIQASSNDESDSRSVGGGLLEKEFEFKPSFSEYLKVMETVKTRREKRQGQNKSNANKWEENSRQIDRPSNQSDERQVQLGISKRDNNLEKKYKAKANNELGENGNGTIKRTRVGLLNDKLRGKDSLEKKYKAKANNELGENGNGTIKRTRVGLLNDKLRGKDSPADADTENLGVTRKQHWLKNQTSSSTPELPYYNRDKSKKTSNAREDPVAFNDVERQGSTVAVEQRNAHPEVIPEILDDNWKTFQSEEIGKREDKTSGRLERNRFLVDRSAEKEVVRKSRLTRRSDRTFYENKFDDSLNVERAAFKSYQEPNDVIGKPRASQMEMEARIQRLAKSLNGADIHMPEWMFSKMIRSARIKFTDHTILRIIQLLGKLGNWRRVLQVIEWLQMCERYKSHMLRNVYTTALNELGKAKRPVEALNVFFAMQQQMSTYPDIVAYHCIAVTLGQAGYMKELFDVIDVMRSRPKKFKAGKLEKWDPRLEPDIVVYNAVLNACVRRKQWEGAFWVLQQLKEQGQKPSTSTYGLIMEVMYACGKYNLVHEFFRKMQKSSLPNALAYKVIVNTLWKEGKIDEAVLAVQDMERRGIVGSAALYYDLARVLCSAGRCEEALVQIKKICKVASKPLVVTYTGLIQACIDSGNIQNAAYIFNEMKHFCSPNLVTCNIMLKAYLENGLFEEAKEFFHYMLEDGDHIGSESDYKSRVTPDIYSFNTMLDACIVEKRWDDFEYVYGRMLHYGYHFNAKRHLRMILDVSRAGKVEPLEMTWKHLVQADRVPPSSLIKERFCIMLERGNYDYALACITANPMEESQAFTKRAWMSFFQEYTHRIGKDTLIRLMHELRSRTARTDSANPALQNLLASCNEFVRTHMKVAAVSPTEIVHTVQSETTLITS